MCKYCGTTAATNREKEYLCTSIKINNTNTHANTLCNGRKNRPNKKLIQNMRFRIAMSTSCSLALQGSST